MSARRQLLSSITKDLLVVGFLCAASNSVNAAAFATNDQSATYLGNAYAGTVSAAQDASTGYYNPAGLSELDASQVLGGATYIDQNIKLWNGTATNSVGDAITGNNPTKPKANVWLAFGHLDWRITDKLSLGFGIIEPFALDMRYSQSDIARLMASENKITTMDLSPSIGYKILPFLSIGAGLDFLRIKTKFASGVEWSSIPSEGNGYVINTASRWVLGYHVGILVKPIKHMQIGAAYFSGFKANFTGATQYYNTNPTNFGNTTGAKYTLKLPDHVNVGVTYDFHPRLTGMVEAGWTYWSKLKTLVFNYNSSALPGLKSFYYKNTWRASLGADFKVASWFTIKTGLAYDQSPAQNAYRSAMVPDSDQYMLAIGARLIFNRYLSIVGGYSYVFYHNTYIAETGLIDALNSSPNVANQSTLNASVKSYANKFGLQLVLNLG